MSTSSRQTSLSYAHGFQAPKKLDIEKAFGKFDDNDGNPAFTKTFFETFDSLPLPKKSTDWLAQYTEKGQTYMEFLPLSRTLHTPSSSHRKTIYLTVFGEGDHTVFDMDSLINYTQRFFQMEVKSINPFSNVQWNEEKNQWTCTMNLTSGKSRHFNLRTRFNEKTKHSQICVTGILNLLKKVVPYDARCLVTLTMYDLYGDDTDLFIAGLSMGNCRVAAFSLYRYDPYLKFNQSDWFDWKLKNATKSEIEIIKRRSLLLVRACRLFTHEICHLLGIDHCIFYSCLMNGSGDLEEDFSQPLLECPVDLRKLYTLINFDIYERYEQLLEFFKIHNFVDQMNIVQIKLDIIKQSMKTSPSNYNSDINSSDSSTSRKIVKRKRPLNITMEKDILTDAAAKVEDEQISETAEKHLKCH